MLQQVFCDEYRYVSSDGNVWVCKTCDRALMRGKIPLQAKTNNLQLSATPRELSDLNPLELRLIFLCIPFLKWLGYHQVNRDVTAGTWNLYIYIAEGFALQCLIFIEPPFIESWICPWTPTNDFLVMGCACFFSPVEFNHFMSSSRVARISCSDG